MSSPEASGTPNKGKGKKGSGKRGSNTRQSRQSAAETAPCPQPQYRERKSLQGKPQALPESPPVQSQIPPTSMASLTSSQQQQQQEPLSSSTNQLSLSGKNIVNPTFIPMAHGNSGGTTSKPAVDPYSYGSLFHNTGSTDRDQTPRFHGIAGLISGTYAMNDYHSREVGSVAHEAKSELDTAENIQYYPPGSMMNDDALIGTLIRNDSPLQRSIQIDVLGNSTLNSITQEYDKTEKTKRLPQDYRAPALQLGSAAIHATKKHKDELGNSLSGIFHSPDVLGSTHHLYNMPVVSRVADQVFPEQKWGCYTIPYNLAHHGSTIKIPGMIHSSIPYHSHIEPNGMKMSNAKAALCYTKVDSLSHTTLLSGALGLSPEPEELEIFKFDNATRPVISKYVRESLAYPDLAEGLSPLKMPVLTGVFAVGATNNLGGACRNLGLGEGSSQGGAKSLGMGDFASAHNSKCVMCGRS